MKFSGVLNELIHKKELIQLYYIVMKRRSLSSTLTSFIRGCIFAVALFSTLITPVYAQTQEWSGVCVGLPGTNASDVATLQGIQCLLANIFTVIITLIGLAGFVMLIVASFRYLVSGGNTKGTETAKNTFLFMIIGIIVTLSGFIVLNLLANFTGIDDITKIVIPGSNRGLPGDTYPQQPSGPQ